LKMYLSFEKAKYLNKDNDKNREKYIIFKCIVM